MMSGHLSHSMGNIIILFRKKNVSAHDDLSCYSIHTINTYTKSHATKKNVSTAHMRKTNVTGLKSQSDSSQVSHAYMCSGEASVQHAHMQIRTRRGQSEHTRARCTHVRSLGGMHHMVLFFDACELEMHRYVSCLKIQNGVH